MHWFTAALLAMIGIAPVFLLTGVAQQHFGVPSAVTAILWFGSASIGMIGWLVISGNGSEIAVVSNVRILIVLAGITIGATSNILLFYSMTVAPNPGLTAAVLNVNALVAFLAAPVLAVLVPQFFPEWQFSWTDIFGILLVVTGLGIISVNNG